MSVWKRGEQEEGQDGRADQLLQEEAEEEDEIPEALVRQQEVLEKKWKEFIKDRRSMPVRNLTFGVPIRSREAGEVLSGVATIYSKMRAMQLPITRLHTDRAKEFSSHRFSAMDSGQRYPSHDVLRGFSAGERKS